MKYYIYASPATGDNKDNFGFLNGGGFIEPLCHATKYDLESAMQVITNLKASDPEGQYVLMIAIE